MAKFRRNHNKTKGVAGGAVTKVGIFAGIIALLFFVFNRSSNSDSDNGTQSDPIVIKYEEPSEVNLALSDNYWPTSTTGEIIEHLNYTLSYSEKHEQAEWVAYRLTQQSIKKPNVERSNDFRPDPRVRKGSASPRDYFGTGYDRGHLVPAGDMNFDKRAMSETFYMSNISPQIRNFNGGIWRELEENTRDWAFQNQEIFVVTGPVLTQGIREKIGDNQVSVPDMYYKVILDVKEPEKKAIAFLLPNEISYKPLSAFAVSIDEVESITGIDFFHQFLEDDFEAELEAMNDISLWEIDSKRQELRIEKWNRRK